MNPNSSLGQVNLKDLAHSLIFALVGVILTTLNTHIPATKEEWGQLGLAMVHTTTALLIMKFGFNSNNKIGQPEA